MWSWGGLKLLAVELIHLPRVTISVCGDPVAERLYKVLTRRHRFKIIQNKSWGVALLNLPDEFAAYLRGKEMQAVRTNRSKAAAAGFRVERVRAIEYVEDICEVNSSMARRQGGEMPSAYLDTAKVRAHCERSGEMYAVLDREGRVRGYAHVLVAGDVAVLSRILGHGADLEKGIMYLCVSEVVRSLCDQRRETGSPLWLMYDTIFGATPGLRYFKERLGFKAYRVRWKWIPRLG